MTARRFVQFVVTSESVTGAELLERLGPADEPVETVGDTVGPSGSVRERGESAWVISSGLGESVSVEAQLAALHRKVIPVVHRIVSSELAHVGSMLRIVQYLPRSEWQGHGFAIGSEWITTLAAVNGQIDVDQYVISEEDRAGWEEIHGFASPGEFERFEIWIAEGVADGVLTPIEVGSPYSGSAMSDERWFRSALGESWRLVAPDPPFLGVFEKVRP